MTSPDSDAIAAALIQIAAHAERISDLDTREAGHHREIASQLTGLAAQADTASTRIATSSSEPRVKAATVPNGMATTTEISMAAPTKARVQRRAPSTSGNTGRS